MAKNRAISVKNWLIAGAVALAISPIPATTLAEARYISDQLSITLRSGESTQHKILRSLKSGTAVKLIESSPESGYTKIRLIDGTEGWVVSRYLSKTPAAQKRLQKAEQKLARLNRENQALKKISNQIGEEQQAHEATVSALQKKNNALEKALTKLRDVAASPLAIDEENRSLKEDGIHMETLIQTLEQENIILSDRGARDWFIAGTEVRLLGIFLGLIAPKLRFAKKQRWNEL